MYNAHYIPVIHCDNYIGHTILTSIMMLMKRFRFARHSFGANNECWGVDYVNRLLKYNTPLEYSVYLADPLFNRLLIQLLIHQATHDLRISCRHDTLHFPWLTESETTRSQDWGLSSAWNPWGVVAAAGSPAADNNWWRINWLID